MKVKILKSVKDGDTWVEPGAVLSLDDRTAEFLIRHKAAEPYETSVIVEDESGEGEGREATTEELNEMAEELEKIDGVNTELAYRLIESGFKTIQSVAEARPEDLIQVKGIGKKSVSAIQESAEDLIDN